MSFGPTDDDRVAENRARIEDMVFAVRRSGLVAYLLWLFLGGFGMHNFYLGRPIAGGLQMAGSLFVYCTYVAGDPWPLLGLAAGVPLGISLLVDFARIPSHVVASSERLRARLSDG